MSAPYQVVEVPFRHIAWPTCVNAGTATSLAEWLRGAPGWGYQEIAGFYQQWRLKLEIASTPEAWATLFDSSWIDSIRCALEDCGPTRLGRLADISANRMDRGMFMKMHNDVGGDIAGRLVVQLSTGWDDASGGTLVLSSKADSAENARLYVPEIGFGFGFQIHRGSFHAVTRLTRDERYTLAYSFAGA